jgi:translation initiation factor 2 beta subunit (eIF-2beta)/eIF-5
MHRQPEHVMAFLLAELGTSGSLDGQQRLVVKGRFLPKVFEGVLRRYVSKYQWSSVLEWSFLSVGSILFFFFTCKVSEGVL